MNKRFLIILAVIIAVFIGLIAFNKKDSETSNSGPVEASNHIQSTDTAIVTLIEYGDFQCPACGAYYPIVKQVKAQYADQLTFQFRHFPLVSIHPNAMAAHRAAEAAGMQGKFFEMHDVLYEQQASWTSSNNASAIFESFAQQLGLNMDQYRTDLVSSVIQDIINADIEAGKAVPATSTPTFVLDGKKVETNPRDAAGFSALIDEAIKAKTGQ